MTPPPSTLVLGAPPRGAWTGPRWPRLACALLAAGLMASCAQCGAPGGKGDGDPDAGAEADAGGPDEGDEALREDEPNDVPAKATVFESVSRSPGSPLLKPLEGALSGPADVDYVRIRAASGGATPSPAGSAKAARTLRVAPLDAGGDVALRWGEALERRWDTAGAGEAEAVLNLGDGEVVVAVVAGAEAKAFPLRYRVELDQRAVAMTLEREGGDDAAETVLSGLGDAQGVANYPGDVDVFKLDLSGADAKAEVVRVEVLPPPGLALEVTLARDAAGSSPLLQARLPADDAPGAPPRAVFPNLAAPRDGAPVWLRLKATGAVVRQGYTVRVVAHPPVRAGVVLEAEPNGPDAPIALEGERAQVQGYLHRVEDRDVFVAALPVLPEDEAGLTPYVVRVALSGESLDWRMGVTLPSDGEAAGGDAATPETHNAGGAGEPELICNRVVPRGGDLRVEVGAASDAGGDDDADAGGDDDADGEGRYALEVAWRVAKDEELEPNATPAQATPLSVGTPVRGFVYPEADVDLFRFVVEPPAGGGDAAAGAASEGAARGGAMTGALGSGEGMRRAKGAGEKTSGGLSAALKPLIDDPDTPDAPPPAPKVALVPVDVRLRAEQADVSLELLDAEGIVVARSARPGVGEDETIRMELPAGAYTLRVRHGSGTATCEAPYTLEVRYGDAP